MTIGLDYTKLSWNAVNKNRSVQRFDDERGHCLPVCPPSKFYYSHLKYVKTSVDKKTSLENLNPCSMCQ